MHGLFRILTFFSVVSDGGAECFQVANDFGFESGCWIGSIRFRTICISIFAVVGLGSIEEIDLLVETSVEVTNSLLNIHILESVVLLRALLFVDGFETLLLCLGKFYFERNFICIVVVVH